MIHDPAMGSIYGESNRESNHDIRSWASTRLTMANVIRLVFPELTEERRKDLAKDVKKKGEAAKVAVRNIRRDANDALKKLGKGGDVSEDEIKDLEEQVQKLTDKFIA